MPMRIALVSDVAYPYIKGGAEKRFHELSMRLKEDGEVHFYCVKWWDGPRVIKKDGITYHGVCRPRRLYTGGRRSIVEALAFGAALALPLLRERFDVIDCNQHPYFSIFSCKLASMLRGGRLFVTWHEAWGDYWYEYMGHAGFFGKLVERLALALSDRIIAVSYGTASSLERLGADKGRISIVPNGISLKTVEAVPASLEQYDVAFAGRLIRDKHVDILLRACSLASAEMPLKVIIIGDGPERTSLEALASTLSIKGRVAFTGHVDDEKLLSLIKSSRLFVLPSTREGFSIITLEALACGVPVITVNGEKNAARELIEDGVNGMVVGLSEEDIGKAILRVLRDEPGRRRMASRCQASVAQYDWDNIYRRILQCYRLPKL
jgi:glycosyltransferase involved in cell wall biosynthesis